MTIPYSRQAIDDDDVQAVVEAMRSDWLTTGPRVEEFEESIATVTGARHAVVFSSGTAALHAACAAGGLGPGDQVATSALSFVASANCARFVGAQPVFVDVERDTLNLAPEAVPSEATALIAVHYAGLPIELARLRGRPRVIIEDAAHALGAHTPEGPVGGCARSDMCAFSFHPVKAITTGEGGAVTTNSERLARELRRFRNHGMIRRPHRGGWAYDIASLGFNYRLTDIQAALGSSQLSKLGQFVEERNQLAHRYRELLHDHSMIELPPEPRQGFRHAYHLFPIRVADRRRIYEELRKREIGVQVHYIPIYRHSIYREDVDRRQYPETERAYRGLLSLPLYPGLTSKAQERVVTVLCEAVNG